MLALLVIASCAGEEVDPKPPVKEKAMVRMLVDVQLLEARGALTKLPMDTLRPVLEEEYDKLFAKHQINKADFEATMKYYEDHPKVLDGVYEKVIDILSSKEAEIKSSAEKKDKPKAAEAGEGPKK